MRKTIFSLSGLLILAMCVFSIAMPVCAKKATTSSVSYGVPSGLYYSAFREALVNDTSYTIGNANAPTQHIFSTLHFAPENNGGFVFNTYTATAEADGTGGFTIETEAPPGAILVYTQLLVDVTLESTTGATWDAALSGGATETIATAQAFAQNTKVSAFFDVNAATPILTDVTNISITPNAGDIEEGSMTGVIGVYEMVDLDDTIAITYSAETFSEAVANDGTLDNSSPITLTLTGATYAWANGVDFVSEGYATVENLPAALTAVLEKTSDTVLTLTLEGTAISHQNADDIANLTITLSDDCFAYSTAASSVVNASKDDLVIDFDDPFITYNTGTFSEAVANDGTLDNSSPITLTLTGATYAWANGVDFVSEGYATVENLPAALTAVLEKTSDTVLTLTLEGTATSHADGDDVADLTITLSDDCFAYSIAASSVANATKDDLVIDFSDPFAITYNAGTFTEAVANDGTIDNSSPITLTLANTTYAWDDEVDFVSEGYATVENLPAALTAVLEKTSDTVLTLTLEGTATSHANGDDVADLTITLSDDCFAYGVAASSVANATKDDLVIDFSD